MWVWAVPSLWFLLAPGPALSSAPEGCGSSVSVRRLGLTGKGGTHSGATGGAPRAFWGLLCTLPEGRTS